MRKKTFALFFVTVFCCFINSYAETEKTQIKLMKPEKITNFANDAYGVDIADVNGDGKLDLIGGNYDGNIYVGLNNGKKGEVKFADPKRLQAAGKDIKIKHW